MISVVFRFAAGRLSRGRSACALAVVAVLLGADAAPSVAAPGPRGRDVTFEQTTHARAGGRSLGVGVVSRVYHAGGKIRLEAGGGTDGGAFVLRLDQGRAFRLDPGQKRAVEVDQERLRAQSQMDASMAGDLMGLHEDARPRTTTLQGTRTIAGHTCRGYRIRAGATVMDLWLAPDLPIGIAAYTDFLTWSGAAASLGALMEALRPLAGFPLETRTRVTVLDEVHETVSTVTRVTVGALPSSLFEIPTGFTVEREAPVDAAR